MVKKVLHTSDNQELVIEVPEPSQYESFFVFSIQKAGSVMLDGIMEDICTNLDIPFINIPSSAFQQGIPESLLIIDEIHSILNHKGYCFAGFRSVPEYLYSFPLENLKKSKKILLIRDPRDILVSHYFSIKNSHEVPTGKQGMEILELRQKAQNIEINDYVLQQSKNFQDLFTRFSIIEEDNLLKVFRYEDIIFNKEQWIEDMLNFLEFNLSKETIKNISNKYDIFPEKEDPNKHIRKVTPGDFNDKLKADTITQLNIDFSKILLKYNY